MEQPLWKRILDFIDIPDMIVALLLLALWLILSAYMPPSPLYIPENDSNSLFPKSPHGSTVPFSILCVVVLGVFELLIIALYFLAKRFPRFFRPYKMFAAGWALLACISLSNIITNIFKNYVGRARPDIYAKCGSDLKSCTAKELEGEFKSWPSGHTATSISGTVFMGLFLDFFFRKRYLAWNIFTALFIIFGIYVGASRIVDFRHHTDDVLAGAFVGLLVDLLIWDRSKRNIFPKESENEEFAPILC